MPDDRFPARSWRGRLLLAALAWGGVCPAHAESVFDGAGDYFSADDRQCRGWRLEDHSDPKGAAVVLSLEHRYFGRVPTRRIELLPQQGWWFEQDPALKGYAAVSLREMLALADPAASVQVLARRDGTFDLFGPTGWLTHQHYAELERASGRFYGFRQGRQVGLLTADGAERFRVTGERALALAPGLAMVLTERGSGLWHLAQHRWLLPPGDLEFRYQQGRVEIVSENTLRILDHSTLRPAPHRYERVDSLGYSGLALARTKNDWHVIDRNGRVLWRPRLDKAAYAAPVADDWHTDGLPTLGEQHLDAILVELGAEDEEFVPNTDDDLLVGGGSRLDPAVRLPGHVLLRVDGRWLLIRQGDLAVVGTFDSVSLAPRTRQTGVFWARRGAVQG